MRLVIYRIVVSPKMVHVALRQSFWCMKYYINILGLYNKYANQLPNYVKNKMKNNVLKVTKCIFICLLKHKKESSPFLYFYKKIYIKEDYNIEK